MEVDDESNDGIIVHPDDPVPWFPEQDQDLGQDLIQNNKPIKLKRRKRCGQCGPCQVKSNCGECSYCVRRSVLKQSCLYRKCIYLRKPVSNPKRSPSKEERVYKRQLLLSTQLSNTYPPELLSPDGDMDSSYEFMSPPEHNYDSMSIDHGDVVFPEFVNSQSIIIEPVATTEDDHDEDRLSPPSTPKQNLIEEFNRHTVDDEEIEDQTPFSMVVSTPPHPMDQEEDKEDSVNPQMMKALKTVEECGHNFVQKPNTPTPNISELTKNMHLPDSEETVSSEFVASAKLPQLTNSRGELVTSPTDSPHVNSVDIPCTNKQWPSAYMMKTPDFIEPMTNQDQSFSTPQLELRHASPFSNSDSPTLAQSRDSHSIKSISSTYTPTHRRFFSPPNVTVGRLGGFRPPRYDSNCHGDGLSQPLNLSGARNVPLNKSSMAMPPQSWSHGMPLPYNLPPHVYPRMTFTPRSFPPPYSIGHYEYPPGYLPYPQYHGNPFIAPRIEGYGQYQAHSLFPPEKYPIHPSMIPGGYYPPPFPHPNEHLIYRTSHSGNDDFSKHPDFRKRSELPHIPLFESESGAELSEQEREEMEEYKKYSIFRLPLKPSKETKKDHNSEPVQKTELSAAETLEQNELKATETRANIEQNAIETRESTEMVKPVEIPPPVRNDTLRRLLNCNNNNVNNISKPLDVELSKSLIDDDLRKEMNKMSGYCSCNFITIDDLKMQALIRSDGVNNLEIEIPSPISDLGDPVKLCADKICVNSQENPLVVKEANKCESQPVTVNGAVCLKQDLGEEGILMLEVQSERVVLVQCVLDDELLRQSNNPKELKEFIMKSQYNYKDNSHESHSDKTLHAPASVNCIRVPSIPVESDFMIRDSQESNRTSHYASELNSKQVSKEPENWKQSCMNLFSNAHKSIDNPSQSTSVNSTRLWSNNMPYLRLPTLDPKHHVSATSMESSNCNTLNTVSAYNISNNPLKRLATLSDIGRDDKRRRILNTNDSIMHPHINPTGTSPCKSVTIMNRLSNFVDSTLKSYNSDDSMDEPMSDSAVMSSDYGVKTMDTNQSHIVPEESSENDIHEYQSNYESHFMSDNFKIISNTDSFYCESESKSETDDYESMSNNECDIPQSSKSVLHDNFEIISNTESVSCGSDLTKEVPVDSILENGSDETCQNESTLYSHNTCVSPRTLEQAGEEEILDTIHIESTETLEDIHISGDNFENHAIPSATVNLESQSHDIPSATVNLESQSHDIPCATINLESKSHAIPCATVNLDSESHAIPCATVNLESESHAIPSAIVNVESQSHATVSLESGNHSMPSASVTLAPQNHGISSANSDSDPNNIADSENDFSFTISSVCSVSKETFKTTASKHTLTPSQKYSALQKLLNSRVSSNISSISAKTDRSYSSFNNCSETSKHCTDQSQLTNPKLCHMTDSYLNGRELQTIESSKLTSNCESMDDIFQSSSHRSITDDSPVRS